MRIRLSNYAKSQVTFLDLKVLTNKLLSKIVSKLHWNEKKNHSTLKCFITTYIHMCLNNYQSTFAESCLMSAFAKFFFGKLKIIEIGPRGHWKRSSIFQLSQPSQKIYSQKLTIRKKDNLWDLSHTKKSEIFDENWRNGGCFSEFSQFCATCTFDFSAS